MSGEIKVVASIEVNKDALKIPKTGGGTQLIDMTGIGGGGPGVVEIGSGGEEDITFTDITTEGWCWMKNLDPANFVQYGPKDGTAMVPFGKLKAGEWCVFRMDPGITLRMIADTAPVNVQIKLFED